MSKKEATKNQVLEFHVTYFKTNSRRKVVVDYDNKEISFYPIGLLTKDEPPLVIPFSNLQAIEVKKNLVSSTIWNHKSIHFIELTYLSNDNEIKTIDLSTSVGLYRLHPLGIFRGIPNNLAQLADLFKEIIDHKNKNSEPKRVTGEETYPRVKLTGWRYWAQWLFVFLLLLLGCCCISFGFVLAEYNSSF